MSGPFGGGISGARCLNDSVRAPLLAGSLLLVLCGACGSPNALDGSIGTVVSLDFNEVLLRKQEGSLVVQFQSRSGERAEILCKVVALVDPLPPKSTLSGDLFRERVTLTRAMLDGSTFPEINRGTLELKRLAFKHGGSVDGRLDVVFLDGNTLNATFSGTLTEVILQ